MPTITTWLAVAAERVLPAIGARAEALGADVTAIEGGARIVALVGTVDARAEGGGLRVLAQSDDPEGLDMLRDAVADFAAGAGLPAPVWRNAAAGGRGRLTPARVAEVRRLSPSYVRVRLAGDFAAFRNGGLHFRLLLGPPGAEGPVQAEDGGLVWPGGIDAWHRPPYTIRAMDPAARWIDLDVFRHDGGRVTEWCDDLRPGDAIALTGPGGKGIRQAGWLGLVGDETALPVILRAVEAAGPQVRGQVAILVPDAADAQPVAGPAGLRIDWVVRDGTVSALDLFRALVPPGADRFLFFAGERQEAQAARAHAEGLGLAAGEFLAAAYWTAGWVPPASQRQARGRG